MDGFNNWDTDATFRNDVENPYCSTLGCNVWCAMDGEISNGIKSGNVKKILQDIYI